MQQPHIRHQSFPLKYWAICWILLCSLLILHTVPVWLQSVSKSNLANNWIPFFSLPLLVFGTSKYWKNRPDCDVIFDSAGLSFLLLTSVLTSGAIYFAFEKLSWLGMLGMAVGIVWSIAGRKYCAYWSPIFLFAVEILPGAPLAAEQWATSQLQRLSALFAGELAGLFIPISTLANSFTVKDTTYQIAPACTGLSLWTSFVFMILVWNIFRTVKTVKLVSLLASSVIVAMLLNATRLTITALVAYYMSSDQAMAIHTNLDFLVFPLGLASLALVRRVLRG